MNSTIPKRINAPFSPHEIHIKTNNITQRGDINTKNFFMLILKIMFVKPVKNISQLITTKIPF